jgi:hypothetical protein
MKYLIILLMLTSCSASWHLKQAIKKNPKLLDSTTKYVTYYKDTNIVINIIGDTSNQTLKYKEWYKQIVDSNAKVYEDTLLKVTQQLDSLGNLKTKVIKKPYKVEVPVHIKDSVPCNCPPQIINEIVEPEYNKTLIIIAIILFLLFLIIKLIK